MSGTKQRPFTIFTKIFVLLFLLFPPVTLRAQIDPTRLDSLKKTIDASAHQRAGSVARTIHAQKDSVDRLVLKQYREADKTRKQVADKAKASHRPGYFVLAGFVVLTLGWVIAQSARKA